MKKLLTASAIALMFGLGAGSAAHTAPVQTLSYTGDSAELHQAGFKKFKHRRNFRSRGFGHRGFKHRRFRHGKFNRGKVFHRRHRDHGYNHGHVIKGGKLIKKGHGQKLHKKHHGHAGHHGHGAVLKKKVITPFGFIFVK